MLFQWDKKKYELNIEKHNIDFEDAKKVFDDYDRINSLDERKDYGEIRYQTIGQVKSIYGYILLLVVWTRRGSKIRLISARPAKSIERRKYDENKN